jgi:hypothetical protein
MMISFHDGKVGNLSKKHNISNGYDNKSDVLLFIRNL